MVTEMQELCCTHCGKYLRFPIKSNKNGNYIIVCDECGHQHCRVCMNGVVTGDRWDSRHEHVSTTKGVMANGSTFDTHKGKKDDGGFLYKAWMNTVK